MWAVFACSLRRRTSAGCSNGSLASSDACTGGAIKDGSFIGGSGRTAPKDGVEISGADDLDAIADAAAAEHNGFGADDASGHQAGCLLSCSTLSSTQRFGRWHGWSMIA